MHSTLVLFSIAANCFSNVNMDLLLRRWLDELDALFIMILFAHNSSAKAQDGNVRDIFIYVVAMSFLT